MRGGETMSATSRDRAWAAAAAVADPEIPVLSIADLGVLRDVKVADGRVEAVITPTYSGCPAMDMIALEVELGLETAGFAEPEGTTTAATARLREAEGHDSADARLDDRLDERGGTGEARGLRHRATPGARRPAGPVRRG